MKRHESARQIMEAIIRFRIPILILIVAILAGAGFTLATKLGIDNSLEVWFVKNDEALARYESFQETFGNDEVITVLYEYPGDVTDDDTRATFLSNTVARLRAISNVTEVHSLLSPLPESFFRSDGTAREVLFIELPALENIDAVRGTVIGDVTAVLDECFGKGKTHLAGIGIVFDALNKISLTDSTLFISASYLIILLVLAFFIRRPAYVFLSILIIVSSVVIAMGVFALSGRAINMVTMVLPTLIMIFGVADVIHIVLTYRTLAGGKDASEKHTLIIESVSSVAFPCLLTSVTTAVGFLTLMTSKMQVIKDFGIFSAIGIIVAYVLSVTLTVIGFSFLPMPRASKRKEGDAHPVLHAISSFVFARKRGILVVGGVLLALAVWGVTRLEVDTYSIQFMKADHPVRVASDRIEEDFGHYTPIEFVLEGSNDDFLRPAVLSNVIAITKTFPSATNVSSAFALPDVVDDIETLPTTGAVKAVLSQVDEHALRRLVTTNYDAVRISGRIKMMSAQGFRNAIEEVTALAKPHVPKGMTFTPTGYLPLYVKMMEYVTNTQVTSFLLAFIIVFAIVAFYAGSLRLSVFAVIANVFPLAATLGIMGWMDVRLDIATVTIAAIGIGVVVDDTMHFLYRFKEHYAETRDTARAVDETILHVGRAIVSTSVVLVLGFTVLCFAQVFSVIYFGLFSAIVILAALFSDLFILPALLLTFPKKENTHD